MVGTVRLGMLLVNQEVQGLVKAAVTVPGALQSLKAPQQSSETICWYKTQGLLMQASGGRELLALLLHLKEAPIN
jgi:hypothetical protein